MGDTAHQLTAGRRAGGSMPGPATCQAPNNIPIPGFRYVQTRPPSARRISHPNPELEFAQSA
eukprot:scaffold3130_cov108-Isochrysis_galbana.AAC.1